MEKRNTITCFLCGGIHIYPGPRFGNHLLHEHGVVLNQEYIVSVSLYKDTYSTLPPILTNTCLDKFSQTDGLPDPSCSLCSKPMEEVKTPVRSISDKSTTSSYPIPGSFCTSKTESLKSGFHSVGGLHTVTKVKDNDIPVKYSSSTFVESSLPWLKIDSGQEEIANSEGDPNDHGYSSSSQDMKIMEEGRKADTNVDENTRTMEGNDNRSSLQLLDQEVEGKSTKEFIQQSEDTEGNSQLEIGQHLIHQNMNSKPLNITDRSNKNCSRCDTIFPSRILFLRHCQDIHKLKFRNKFGSPLLLGKRTTVVGEEQFKKNKLPVPMISKKSLPSYPSSIPSPHGVSRELKSQTSGDHPARIQSPSLSSTLPLPLFKCQFCSKAFSNKGNRDRHVRQSCMQRGLPEQVEQINDQPVKGSKEGTGPGFKCYKCDKVYFKWGYLNRHFKQVHGQYGLH